MFDNCDFEILRPFNILFYWSGHVAELHDHPRGTGGPAAGHRGGHGATRTGGGEESTHRAGSLQQAVSSPFSIMRNESLINRLSILKKIFDLNRNTHLRINCSIHSVTFFSFLFCFVLFFLGFFFFFFSFGGGRRFS